MIPRQSTDAELEALHAVCERLGGFDARVSVEWLDGALSAVAAGPRVPPLDETLAALLGDVWGRTFGDPDDDAQARAAIAARWRVLLSQLDPESLYEDPDRLRLVPLLMVPADDADPEGADEAESAEAEIEPWPMGAEWAQGFMSVAGDPAWGWQPPAPTDDEAYQAALELIGELQGGEGSDEERDERIDAACYAVQDLRLWWLENAPRTAPRKVEAVPGRNDPCFCGSGRKYKKCHGAA